MYDILSDCRLFRDFDPEAIETLLATHGTTRNYTRGDVVAAQGAKCDALMILAEGQLSAETLDRRGQKISVEKLSAPALVAPWCLFAENPALPATLGARTPASIISIPRSEFIEILKREGTIMRNFLEILSSQNKFTSERTVYLSCKSIRGKIARYLLDRAAAENNNEFRNPLTQREMAELFGVTRPALAKEMGELSRQGTIFVKGKHVTIIFGEKLRQYIKQ